MVIQRGDKPPLEAAEEAELLRELKKLPVALKIRKMNGLGNRDWPDRMVLGPKRFVFFIEMKRKKIGKVSPGQQFFLASLEAFGFPYLVADDGKVAAEAVRTALIAHGVMK